MIRMNRFKSLGAVLVTAILAGMGAVPSAGEEPPAAGSSSAALTPIRAELPPLAAGRGRQDPFAPLPIKRPPPQGMYAHEVEPEEPEEKPPDVRAVRLSGIVWSATRPMAVINDSLVGIDDKVAGWSVVSIERNSVVLEARGIRETLKINSLFHDKGDRQSRLKETE